MNKSIRKFNGPDGKRAWALTHVDAVMGNDGRTLGQLLGNIPKRMSVMGIIEALTDHTPENLDTLGEIVNYMKIKGYDSVAAALADKADVSSLPTNVSSLTNDAGYLQDQSLKTINGVSLVGTGNIAISGSGTGDIVAGDVVDTIGE